MHDPYPYIDPAKLNLNGKSVFITGASKGIGAALATAYAKAGASVIGLGSRSSQEDLLKVIRSAAVHAGRPEPNVFSYAMDVTDPASVEKAAASFATDAGGRLDILVNNAGYLSYEPIVDSDPLDWWTTWEVNVKGVYLSTRYFLPIMLKDSKSQRTVVNTSSLGAHHIGKGCSAYQTSKLAVSRFTEFLGAEYGDQGVVAFSVHPGAVLTDMGAKFSKASGVSKFPLDPLSAQHDTRQMLIAH